MNNRVENEQEVDALIVRILNILETSSPVSSRVFPSPEPTASVPVQLVPIEDNYTLVVCSFRVLICSQIFPGIHTSQYYERR